MCAKVRNKTDISKFVVQSLIIVLRRGISREMIGERPPKHSASGAVFLMFNVSHAAGHAQCRCDGRQHTNGCLNREFPKCLVLHGNNVLISHR